MDVSANATAARPTLCIRTSCATTVRRYSCSPAFSRTKDGRATGGGVRPGGGNYGRVKVDMFAENRLEQTHKARVFGKCCGGGRDGGGGAEDEFGGGGVGREEGENLAFWGWEHVLSGKRSVGWGGIGGANGHDTMCGLFGSVETDLKATGLPRPQETEYWKSRALRNIGDL